MASTQRRFKHNKNNCGDVGQIKRLPCEPSETPSQEMSERETEPEGELTMEEFILEIEERWRMSVANKLYTFPRRF
jgi:hypothetical protein